MTIVADSGSTKTTWIEVESGNKIVTEGLNPHFTNDEAFLATCDYVRQQFSFLISQFSIFFYGAGCGNKGQQRRVQKLLASGFNVDNVDVETDMLGACRAVSAGKESLVAILGTGSNACFFDGEKIIYQPISTGYILGDKGSANHVGRIMLDEYLTHSAMPLKTRKLFHDTFRMSDAQFIDAVYHQPNPNRFLASLAPFAVENKEDDYCYGTIWGALLDFHADTLVPITWKVHRKNCTLNIIGGFAKAIESIIDQFFHEEGINIEIGNVEADPIDGLREYHKTHNTI